MKLTITLTKQQLAAAKRRQRYRLFNRGQLPSNPYRNDTRRVMDDLEIIYAVLDAIKKGGA